MPESKPRCVFPREGGAAACNKTEAQHGPTTGHAFTLEHIPEPTPLRPEGKESTPCPVCRRLWTGEPGALYTCVGRPGLLKHPGVYFKIGDGTPLVEGEQPGVMVPFAGHPDGCEHLEHTPATNRECIHRPTWEEPVNTSAAGMMEGDPLEGTLLSSVPDPTVTLRTEMPDGTLVEVTVAHPHHDTVKMARAALVAAEYVMSAIARDDARTIQHPVPD